MNVNEDRFTRLKLVNEFTEASLTRLMGSKVVIVGCGATGTHLAEALARIGIRTLKVIDKDVVSWSNLYRTALFTEDDALKAMPKAISCAQKIVEVNTSTQVEPVVDEVNPLNIENLLQGYDLIIDATDNMDSRLLINEFSVKHGIPWVMTGVESWYGNSWLINTRAGGPCFKCLSISGGSRRCRVLGVTPMAVKMVTSASLTLAVKHLLGLTKEEDWSTLHLIDSRELDVRKIHVAKNPECPTCQHRKFELLGKDFIPIVKPSCGKNNVIEITPPEPVEIDLNLLLKRRQKTKVIASNPYTVKLKLSDKSRAIIFRSGRALIEGLPYRKAIEAYETLTGIKISHKLTKTDY